MTNGAELETTPEMFKILKSSTEQGVRLGRLALPGRTVMKTPHYLGLTSRGVVPHLSQDNIAKKTNIKGLYIPLEDFIEKASANKIPPVLGEQSTSLPSPLRDFISASDEQILVLGARRIPAVVSPWSNSLKSISIYTSVGFGKLTADDYVEAALKLKPDIMVGLGDIPDAGQLGSKRIDKMNSRTEHYMRDTINYFVDDSQVHIPQLFAPILPIPLESQSFYLDMLTVDWLSSISGLAIHDPDAIPNLPESLLPLPRLSLSDPRSPLALLREISLGNDIFTLPFIGSATDAGIALDFHFPVQPTETKRELGHDMWSVEYATSLAPLVQGCDCYACQKHHRAYMQHLLCAKEMLAWVLLQIHNLRVIDAFFAGVRESIASGTFEHDVEVFTIAYQAELPEKTGQGPRVRGYTYKSDGPGEGRRNPAAFSRLNGRLDQNVETPPMMDRKVDVNGLEAQGLCHDAVR